MKATVWLGLILALSVSACDKKKDEKSEPKKATVQKLSDNDVDKADVPVPENFEVKARSTINSDNLEKQVEALEKQINSDK
jgi:hypothetical protein